MLIYGDGVSKNCMTRLPLLKQQDLPDEYQYLLGEEVLGERNIFRAMGNNPSILRSYMLYGNTLWEECGLDARERELVILAVSRTIRSQYEWQQHYDIGLDAGVTVEEIRRIGRDELSTFNDRIQVTLRYAQSFATGNIADDDITSMSNFYDSEAILGIGMLASHYVATERILSGLNVPLESGFIGWEPTT